MDALAREIIQRAYALDPTGLDATLASLGLSAWPETVETLSVHGWDTGGGCMMLVADLPGAEGHQIGITNGDAEFPRDAQNFWVGIMDPDGDELYYMYVVDGQRQGHLQV
ncbi:hypothetical protein HLB42_16440 [Deinococcus sp. D7000]|nr:hypothetical protein HLB42_16440 [Deinococcus sp. D7000]